MWPAKQSEGRTKHPGGCAEDYDGIVARRVPRLPGGSGINSSGDGEEKFDNWLQPEWSSYNLHDLSTGESPLAGPQTSA